MALFKIYKGEKFPETGQIIKATEGFAYFTSDDGKFYIDISGDGTEDAVIRSPEHPLGNRIPLNAYKADIADKINKILTINLNKENDGVVFDGSENISIKFYAPIVGGTNAQALIGDGVTTTPKWANIDPNITITDGDANNAPKINITVLGQNGTAQAITTATIGIYGVTKLTSIVTLDTIEESLAVTPKGVIDAINRLNVDAVGVVAATGNRYISQISEINGKISAVLAAATIGSKDTPIWINAGTITAITGAIANDITGNANTATAFASDATISLTGDITGSATGTHGWSISTTIGAGKVTNNMLAGSITNNKLVNSTIGIAGTNIALGSSIDKATLLSNLGLTNAAHYIGKATKELTDGGTENPTISGYDFANDRKSGDIVLGKDGDKEYIWGLNGWELLGPVDTIQTSTATGTKNCMAYYSAANMISSGDSIYADTSHLTINGTAIPANSGSFQVIGTSTMRTILPEEDSKYYLGNITNHWASGYIDTFYISNDINFKYVAKNGDIAAHFEGDGIYLNKTDLRIYQADNIISARLYLNTLGTVDTAGVSMLTLGNSIVTENINNSSGILKLYSPDQGYMSIKASTVVRNHLHYLPIYSTATSTSSSVYYGRLVGIYKSTTVGDNDFEDVGSTSQPVYVTANGVVKAITTLGIANGGTGANSRVNAYKALAYAGEFTGDIDATNNEAGIWGIGSETSYTAQSLKTDLGITTLPNWATFYQSPYVNTQIIFEGYPGQIYIRSREGSSDSLTWRTWKVLKQKPDNAGHADTATKWAAAQKVYVTLGTADTTTTIQGGSPSAQTIGVDGILGTAHGGTGNNSYTASRLVYSNTAATKLVTGNIVSEGNYISNVTYLNINQAHSTTYRLNINGASNFIGDIYLQEATEKQTAPSSTTTRYIFFHDKNAYNNYHAYIASQHTAANDHRLIFATYSSGSAGSGGEAAHLQLISTNAADHFIQVEKHLVINQTANARDNGIYGVYNSAKAATIWSMGRQFKIANDGSGLGNLYGAAYGYQNQDCLENHPYASGHQFLWCNNGTVHVALGTNLWARNTIIASSNPASDVTIGTNNVGSFIYNNGVMKLNSTNGAWAYLRLHNGNNLWDIGTRSSDSSGALQFRPTGKPADSIIISTTGNIIANSTASSWLDGQQYENGGLNLRDATNTISYWPWIRQTNTGSSKWFSMGVSDNSLYIIGSATSRTAKGMDHYWRFDVSNGYLYGNFSGSLSGNANTATAANITSTDNAIVRFDGTAGKFQNSTVIIDDNGYINSKQFKTSSGQTILNDTGYITIYPYDRNTYGNETPTPARFLFTEKAYTTGVPAKTLIAWSGIDNIKINNFIGALKGNADTATKWAAAQKVYVTLGTASTTTTIQGGSTTAQTIGVDGILGTTHGGTGNDSFSKDTLIYANTTTKLASYTSTKGGTKKLWYLKAGVPTDSTETVGAATRPVYVDDGTITAIDTSQANYTHTFTVTGNKDTWYPVVFSNTADKSKTHIISIWKNLGSTTAAYSSGNHNGGTSSMWLIYEHRYHGYDGNGGYCKTWYYSMPYADLVAKAQLLGRGVGKICVWLRGGTTEYNVSADYNITATPYYSETNVGTSSAPVNVAPVTTVTDYGWNITSTMLGYGNIYGNATTATVVSHTLTITLNNSAKTFNGSAGTSVSFYAPTAGGTANTQALVGNGATAAPKWVNISPSITITAGTASATPKVNVTVLGQSGTAQAITTATTGVYGATKLTDAYTSTDATLAATGKSILAAIQTLNVAAVGVAAATGNRYISQISEINGKISAVLATATIGSATKPIWINAGTIKAGSYELKATVNNATQWGVAYYSTTTNLTSTAQGTSGYVLTSNGAAAPTYQTTKPYLAASTSKAYVVGTTATGTSHRLVYYNASVYTSGTILYGAAWNDYAEFRQSKENKKIEPGKVVYENGDDTLSISNKRLMRGCNIVSDTYGFGIGESEEAQLPIAVSGRVLAYPYENREEFKTHIGWPVCSGPNGTVSIMTEEEEMKYPSRIIGTISAVPDYEIWHGGIDVIVNGRVWIKVR